MNILVTGAKGFIGKNLTIELRNRGYVDIFEFDKETDFDLLDLYCKNADFVYHLAGSNRPIDNNEYMDVNHGLTSILINKLKKYNNKCPVMMSSSIQAELNNAYGLSKKAGEDVIFSYGNEVGSNVLVYRLPNVFGKWCRPNYNSAVATFCNNIARDIPITVNDPDVIMNLAYIDDVVNEFIKSLEGNEFRNGAFCIIPETYYIRLGDIVNLIYGFKESRTNFYVPEISDNFAKKLYSTYLSYLPNDEFSYKLKMNIDNRGSFTEFIKTINNGQVSINVSKPGITKGNHWHHTKNEKFLVVSGQGVIRFRKISDDEVLEYKVNADVLEVVDIPVGYTHNIENIGNVDLVTVMWANEAFDPKKPDTYFLEV